MGRDCGYLPLAGAVATGADAVLLPEKNPERTKVVKSLERLVRHSLSGDRQKRRVLVLKVEGVRIPTEALVAELSEAVADMKHVEVRSTVLGHIVRGGNPTFRDQSIRTGGCPGHPGRGESGVMVCWSTSDRGEPTSDAFVKLFPLDSVLQETKLLTAGASDLQNERFIVWRPSTAPWHSDPSDK